MKNSDRIAMEGGFMMDTDAGPVFMINTNFVDPKVFIIFKQILDEFYDTGHGLTSIMFRKDGYPDISEDDYTTWVYQPDSMSAVCNINHCVEAAANLTLDMTNPDTVYIAIKTLVWENIIKGFLHELHHAQLYMTDRIELDESVDARAQEEIDAIDYSSDKLIAMAKDIDIEMCLGSLIDSLVYQEFCTMKTEIETNIAAIEAAADIDADGSKLIDDEGMATIALSNRWITLQQHMLDTGKTWYTDGEGEDEDGKEFSLTTFKEYMCWRDESDMTKDDWKKDTIGIAAQVEFIAPPPATPIAPVATTQPMYAPAPVAMAAAAPPPGTVTDGAGWVSNNPNEEIYEDYDDEYTQEFDQKTAAQSQAAPPAQQGGFQSPVGNQTPQTPQSPPPTAAAAPPQSYAPNVQGMVENGACQVNMGTLMHGLYKKLFDHIFYGCQWDKAVFQEKSAINMRLMLTPDEDKVVTSMVTQNETGAYMEIPADAFISGKIMDKNKELPGYEFKFIDYDGKPGTRKLVPQNPKKTRPSDGKPSYTAELAQHGWHICWVIDPEAADKALTTRLVREPDTNIIRVENNLNGKWE